MMDLPRNRFKHAIAAGHLQIGLWCSLCSNIAADIVRDSGFDWLLLDTEHSPNEIPDVLKRAVEAVRYPSAGVRGVAVASRASRYGRVTDYLKNANGEVCLLVQVETRSAMDQLEAIATVEGVEGVFIGPSDLSASLGHIGNPAHPDVQKALETCVRRLKAVGKPAGILTGNEEEVRRYISWGYTFVAVGSDVGLLSRGADALAKKFRS